MIDNLHPDATYAIHLRAASRSGGKDWVGSLTSQGEIHTYWGKTGHINQHAAKPGDMHALQRIIDQKKNELGKCRNAELDITSPGSRVKVYVIPTDEELVMTEDAYALMNGTYDVHTNYSYAFQKRDYVNKARAEGLERDLVKKPYLADIVAKLP